MEYSPFKINNKISSNDITLILNNLHKDFQELPDLNLVLYCSELQLIFESSLKINKIKRIDELLSFSGVMEQGPNRKSVKTDWNNPIPINMSLYYSDTYSAYFGYVGINYWNNNK